MNWSTEIMSVDTESRIFLYILGFSNELSPYMLSKSETVDFNHAFIHAMERRTHCQAM